MKSPKAPTSLQMSDTLSHHRPSELLKSKVRDAAGQTAFEVYEPVYGEWPESARPKIATAEPPAAPVRRSHPSRDLHMALLFATVFAISVTLTAVTLALLRTS